MQPNYTAIAAATAFSALLAGCVVPPNGAQQFGTATAPAGAQAVAATAPATPAAAGASLATMQTYQYIRVDGDKTGVVNSADDGRYTYVAFGRPVPEDVQFFDDEGNSLMAARSGPIVALPGIYKGILVRLGRQNTYIAPNPRATSADRPSLESDPQLIEARNRLEVATTQMPAFQRAMAKADAAARRNSDPAFARADSASLAGGAPSASSAGSRYEVPPLPPLKPVSTNDPTYQRTNSGVLIRVFFASGGRAIVRPDDGLQRLEAEARDAQEVRISGYTDAIGAADHNAALAQQRADAIKALLVQRGVPENKIFTNSIGASNFIADNMSERGRAMNRRVEVLFVQRPRS